MNAQRLSAEQSTGYLDLTVRIVAEDGEWLAECVELGVSSCGDTVEAAALAVVEAIGLYLQTVDESGLLEQTLRDAGLEIRRGIPPAM